MLNQTGCLNNWPLNNVRCWRRWECYCKTYIECLIIKREPSRVQTSSKVRIWSPDPDDFRKLTGTFLSRDASLVKFSWRSSRGNVSENAKDAPQCWRTLKKLRPIPNAEMDHFQNLTSSSLSRYISKWSFREIFTKVSSLAFMWSC